MVKPGTWPRSHTNETVLCYFITLKVNEEYDNKNNQVQKQISRIQLESIQPLRESLLLSCINYFCQLCAAKEFLMVLKCISHK